MLLRRRGPLLALNRRHFAARGANFLAVSNGGPTLYDIVTRQPSTNTNAPTGARDPLIGNASTFANNTKLAYAGRSTTAYTACTWAVLFKLNTSNAGLRTIASDGATPGTTGSAIRVAGGGGIQFRPNTTSIAGTLTLVTGGYYFGLASFVQSAAGSLTSVVTRRLDTNELNVVTGNANVAPVPGGTIQLGDIQSATVGALMDVGFVFQAINYTPLKQLLDWSSDPFSIFEDDQNDWLPLFGRSGPTVYAVSAIAVSNSVAQTSKSVSKPLLATGNSVGQISKSVGKSLLATAASVALEAHNIVRTVSAIASSNSVALISKAVSKSLVATGNSVALLSAIKTKLVNAIATSNSVAFSSRTVGKSLIAASNAVGLIQKTVSKPLLAVSNGIALCVKAVNKGLLASSNSIALNSFIKAKLVSVVATSNSVALASRGVGKNLIVASNSAAQIKKSIVLNRIASSNSVALIAKAISASRLAVSNAVAYCTKTIPVNLLAVSHSIAIAITTLAASIYIEWPERLFNPKARDRNKTPRDRSRNVTPKDRDRGN